MWKCAAAVIALAVGLAGCEGDGIAVFSSAPAVIELNVPASVAPDATMVVNVVAASRRGVAAVTLEYSGAITSGETITVSAPQDTVSVTTSLQIVGAVDSLLIVTARARDTSNRLSAPVSDTVRIIQPVASAFRAGSRH